VRQSTEKDHKQHYLFTYLFIYLFIYLCTYLFLSQQFLYTHESMSRKLISFLQRVVAEKLKTTVAEYNVQFLFAFKEQYSIYKNKTAVFLIY